MTTCILGSLQRMGCKPRAFAGLRDRRYESRHRMEAQRIFAANVRAYRKAAHLSQLQLAELAGLHRTYIGGIEQGRVNVSLKNICRIADALGVEPAVLFIGHMKPSDSEEPAYSLVIKKNGSVSSRPINVAHEDLTIRVLSSLIRQGFHGNDLERAYDATVAEVERFIQ